MKPQRGLTLKEKIFELHEAVKQLQQKQSVDDFDKGVENKQARANAQAKRDDSKGSRDHSPTEAQKYDMQLNALR